MIGTREQFKQYCLRALGAPVIEINVADIQVEDRIDDALQKYFDFHQNGVTHLYLKHLITENDVMNGGIRVDLQVAQVVRVLTVNGGKMSRDLNYVAYMQDMISQIQRGGAGGLGQYVTQMSNLNLMNDILNIQPSVSFVKYGNFLRLDSPNDFIAGNHIVMECYVRNEAIDYPQTWNDSWLKRYATALIKKQWANNLIKYNGATLPSGITINADTILSEANTDIQSLEEELRETWEVPVLGQMA